MKGKIASRTSIAQWMNQTPESLNLKLNYQFYSGLKPVKLNAAEINIAHKIDVGKTNPVFHYPILTKTSSAEYPLNQASEAMSAVKSRMEQPDVITGLTPPFYIPTYPGI